VPGRWLIFDCFGTLIDWRHGIRTTGELLFPGHGPAFLDAYIAIEAEVETEGSFRRYRAILTETTRRAARQLALDLKPDDATALVSTIPHWAAWPTYPPRWSDWTPLAASGERSLALEVGEVDRGPVHAPCRSRLDQVARFLAADLQVAARHLDRHLVVDQPPAHARRRHSAGACT
jgi:hypothetical protein